MYSLCVIRRYKHKAPFYMEIHNFIQVIRVNEILLLTKNESQNIFQLSPISFVENMSEN